MGYKAIGLEYPDDTADPKASAVGQICAQNPDPGCSARIRFVRIWGGAADGVEVSPADGWRALLANGHVNWNRVGLGGHSQGAGMAAFLVKRFAVGRVALWSGPTDYLLPARSFAPWLSAASATPADRWFALVHRDESGSRTLLAAYEALGVPRTPAVADTSVPSGTHVFVVTLPPRPAAGAEMPAMAGADHGSVAGDLRTPLAAAGLPAYAPVWRAMMGPQARAGYASGSRCTMSTE
jgi:hypothetical protein